MVINVSILLTLEVERHLHVFQAQNQQKNISKRRGWEFFFTSKWKTQHFRIEITKCQILGEMLRQHCASFSSVTGLNGFALWMLRVKLQLLCSWRSPTAEDPALT